MTISQQIVQSLRTESQVSDNKEENEIFGIDEHLRSSSKKILLQRIDFVEAKLPYHFNLKKLKSKYVLLNPNQDKTGQNSSATMSPALKVNSPSVAENSNHDGIPPPKMVLFSAEKIELSWKKAMRAGAGLSNLGNTCFLNSALQCLAYTAPLANYLIHVDHRKNCRVNGQFCMLCAMQQHLYHVHSNSGQAIKPMYILKNLRMIAKHLQFGRQEDAHEFIRYSVDAMQKSCLFGYSSKMDVHIKATTAVHQIFGGYLRSRVKCSQCKSVSDTYDPFLDLSLDINKQGCGNLQRCLEMFVRTELLQGDNAYKCMQCKHTVQACKKFSIHRAPNVLMLQLKRFSHFMGHKINKELMYPSKLNIGPYMSNKPDGGYWYELYAVLVHSGFSCNSGHYYAYAKAPNGQWYCFNDSSVHQVSVNQALSQQAYLLFYSRNPKASAQLGNFKQSLNKNLHSFPSNSNSKVHLSNSSNGVANGVKTNGTTGPQKIHHRPVIGPQLPSSLKREKEYTFKSTSSSKDTGSPVAKKPNQPKVIALPSAPTPSTGVKLDRKPLQFSISAKPKIANPMMKLTNGGQNHSSMTKSQSFTAQNGTQKVQSTQLKSSTLPGTSSSGLRSPILDQFLKDSTGPGTSSPSSSSANTSHSSLSSTSNGGSTPAARTSLVSYSSDDSDDDNNYDTPLKTDYSSLTSTLKKLRGETDGETEQKLSVMGNSRAEKTKNHTEKESSSKKITLKVGDGGKTDNVVMNGHDKKVEIKGLNGKISPQSAKPSENSKRMKIASPVHVKLSSVGKSDKASEREPILQLLNNEKTSQREPILDLLNDEIKNGIRCAETEENFTAKTAKEKGTISGKSETRKMEADDAGRMENGHQKQEESNKLKKDEQKPFHNGIVKENGLQNPKKMKRHEDSGHKTHSSERNPEHHKLSKERKRHHSSESTSFVVSPHKEKNERHEHHNHHRKRSPSPARHRFDKKAGTPSKKRKREKSDRRHHSEGYSSDDSSRGRPHKSRKDDKESPRKKKGHDRNFFRSALKRSHSKANGKYSDESDSSVDRLYCDKKEYEQSLRRKAKKDKEKRLKERQILQHNIDKKTPPKSDHERSVSCDRHKEVNGKEKTKNKHSHDSSKSREHHGDKHHHHHENSEHHHDKKAKREKHHENGKDHKKEEKRGRESHKLPTKDRPNILQQLLKQSSGKAYGSKVGTWNGDESLVEKDAQQTWSELRTPLVDDWDREYDKGKVKKYKKKDKEGHKIGHNIFQKFQNMKNQRNGV